jgi:hypothetical protein
VIPDATESAKGGLEVATQAEARAGTLDTKIITPQKLFDVFEVPPAIGSVTPGTGAFTAITGSSITTTGNGSIGGTLGVTGATTLSSTLAVTGASTFTGTATFNGSSVFNGAFTINDEDDGALAGPAINLVRVSASPAANDILGRVIFYGYDSGGNQTTYAFIEGEIIDPTNGSEDARMNFRTQIAGTTATRFQIGHGLYANAATGGDQGAGTINAVNYYKNGSELTLGASGVFYRSSTQGPITSATKIQFTSTDHNTLVRGSYDGATNYRYTATAACRVIAVARVTFTGLDSTDEATLEIRKNGTTIGSSMLRNDSGANSLTRSLEVTKVTSLSAGQYLEVYLTSDTDGVTTAAGLEFTSFEIVELH